LLAVARAAVAAAAEQRDYTPPALAAPRDTPRAAFVTLRRPTARSAAASGARGPFGARQGVLLPALDGVDSVDTQLRIALQKAGIGRQERYAIGRFTVTKLGPEATR